MDSNVGNNHYECIGFSTNGTDHDHTSGDVKNEVLLPQRGVFSPRKPEKSTLGIL